MITGNTIRNVIINSEEVNRMVKKIEIYMNRTNGSVFSPKLEFVKGKTGSCFENYFWWRCKIDSSKLNGIYKEYYTHILFMPYVVNDLEVQNLNTNIFPNFDRKSGNVHPEIIDQTWINNWIKDPGISQIVLVSDKNKPMGPKYKSDEIIDDTTYYVHTFEKSKAIIPYACYYPLTNNKTEDDFKTEDKQIIIMLKKIFDEIT